MVRLEPSLRRGVLLRSVNGNASAMIERVRDRWPRVVKQWSGPRLAFEWGVSHASYAAWCCQEAFGLIKRPVPVPGQPGGAWDPVPDPAFVRALYAGRTIETVAHIGCEHSLLQDSLPTRPDWSHQPEAEAAVERDFWLSRPGNEERLLRAMRDMVLRRVAHRGGERLGNWYRMGPDEYDPCADAWPNLWRIRGYEVGPPDPRALPGDVP